MNKFIVLTVTLLLSPVIAMTFVMRVVWGATMIGWSLGEDFTEWLSTRFGDK